MPDDPALLKSMRKRVKAMLNVYSVAALRRIGEHIKRERGDPSQCQSCNEPIFWLQMADGKKAPFDHDLHSHFSTCPWANKHRRAKGT